MRLPARSSLVVRILWAHVLGCLALAAVTGPAWAARDEVFGFEDADLHAVVAQVGQLTGITFLFDPEHVTGRIAVLPSRRVSAAEALALLESALALHGYALVRRAEGTWIVPAAPVARQQVSVRIVRLNYARAGELAHTLSRAVPWLRIVPHVATNSLVISGPPEGVEELVELIAETAASR
jgi:type II secretory pathway component GspD/PulD (secretin)